LGLVVIDDPTPLLRTGDRHLNGLARRQQTLALRSTGDAH
jgi:hypothetical protein